MSKLLCVLIFSLWFTCSLSRTHLEHIRRQVSLAEGIRIDRACESVHQDQWNHAVNSRYPNDPSYCVSKSVVAFHGPSGPGSSLETTKPLREMLNSIFHNRSMSVRTFADIPCGDWLWMQEVNLSGVQYLGGDISEETIKRNNRCFRRPNVEFVYFDLTCMVPPAVDLILVRDILFHLKPEVAIDILGRLVRSGIKYIASTTYPKTGRPNSNWRIGAYQETLKDRPNSQIGYYSIRLNDSPFNFPEPLMQVEEDASLPGHKLVRRLVGVWELHDLDKYFVTSGGKL